jgi:hypothetical protein
MDFQYAIIHGLNNFSSAFSRPHPNLGSPKAGPSKVRQEMFAHRAVVDSIHPVNVTIRIIHFSNGERSPILRSCAEVHDLSIMYLSHFENS